MDSSDPLMRRLAQLPFEAPPAESTQRVRTRCHAALARRRRHNEAPRTWGLSALLVHAALIAALCFYLAQAAGVVLQVAR